MRIFILLTALAVGTLAVGAGSQSNLLAVDDIDLDPISACEGTMVAQTFDYATTTPLWNVGYGAGHVQEQEKPEWCHGQTEVCTHLYSYCKSVGKRDVQCKADWTAIQIEANTCHDQGSHNDFSCLANALWWASDVLCYWPTEWRVCDDYATQLLPDAPRKCYVILTDCIGTGRSLEECVNVFADYSAHWEYYCHQQAEPEEGCENFMAQWGYYYYYEIFNQVDIVDTCRLDHTTCPPKHYCEEDNKAISIWLPNGVDGVQFCLHMDEICVNGQSENPGVVAQCEQQWHSFSQHYYGQCPHFIDAEMHDGCHELLWDYLELYYFQIFTYMTETSVTTHTHVVGPEPIPTPTTEFCGQELNSEHTYFPMGITAAQFCDMVAPVLFELNQNDAITVQNHWNQLYWNYAGICGTMPTTDMIDQCHNVFVTNVQEQFFMLCPEAETEIKAIFHEFDWSLKVIPPPDPTLNTYWCETNPLYEQITFVNGQNGLDVCHEIGVLCLRTEGSDPHSCAAQWDTFFMHYSQGCFPQAETYNTCHDNFIFYIDEYYFDVYPNIETEIIDLGIITWEYTPDWVWPQLPDVEIYWCNNEAYTTAVINAETGQTMYDVCVETSSTLIQQYQVDPIEVEQTIFDFWIQYNDYCPEGYFYHMSEGCYQFYYDWTQTEIITQFPDIIIDIPEPVPIPAPHFEYCENGNLNVEFSMGGTLQQFCRDISDICTRTTDNNYECQNTWNTFITEYFEICGDQTAMTQYCHDIAVSLIEYEYFTIDPMIQELFIHLNEYVIETTYIDVNGNYQICSSFNYETPDYMHGMLTWVDTCNIMLSVCMNDPLGSYHSCSQVYIDFVTNFQQRCFPGSDVNRDPSCHNYFIHLTEEYFFTIFDTMRAEIIAIGHPSLDIVPTAPMFPVVFCDSNLLGDHIGYTGCHSDLEHCQQLAKRCLEQTNNDEQTCGNNWMNYQYNTGAVKESQHIGDPYQEYYNYETMKAIGNQLYGYWYNTFIAELEVDCPGPQAPPPDPLAYCDSGDYNEVFWGQDGSVFCRFMGSMCANENGGAFEMCQVQWINFYHQYTDVCTGGALHDGSDNPYCGCEKNLMQESGPDNYGDYFEAWGYTFFVNHSGTSACPCATRTSGLRENFHLPALAQGKNQICKK